MDFTLSSHNGSGESDRQVVARWLRKHPVRHFILAFSFCFTAVSFIVFVAQRLGFFSTWGAENTFFLALTLGIIFFVVTRGRNTAPV
jgi:hypothetical protein